MVRHITAAKIVDLLKLWIIGAQPGPTECSLHRVSARVSAQMQKAGAAWKRAGGRLQRGGIGSGNGAQVSWILMRQKCTPVANTSRLSPTLHGSSAASHMDT